MKRVLLVCGTRPEAIKLAPVFAALRERPKEFDVALCVTGQHRQLLDPVLRFFGLSPEFDLGLMRPAQDLAALTAVALTGIKTVLDEAKPDVVLVQGDTTTAFAGALAAFYARVKVGHVEAGLRTHDRASPYPEEMNRCLISRIAEYHFAPTAKAQHWLEAEGIHSGVFLTGNTVTDALLVALRVIEERYREEFEREFMFLERDRRLILVTGHRRESFGGPFESICRAIRALAEQHQDVDVVYPMHLNPNVREPVERILSGVPRVHLIEPVDYPRLVWLLSRAHFVLTDSGGIQEEAPSLGVPALVMREVTERPEGIEAGCARLVGTDEARILAAAHELLTDPLAHQRMAQAKNPYGDGRAAERIADILQAS